MSHVADDVGFAGAARAAPARRLHVHWTDRIGNAVLVAAAVALALFLLAPVAAILVKSVQDRAGEFAGLANFREYFRTPALLTSIWNSLWVSALVTAITKSSECSSRSCTKQSVLSPRASECFCLPVAQSKSSTSGNSVANSLGPRSFRRITSVGNATPNTTRCTI